MHYFRKINRVGKLGMRSLIEHKLRSLLTALGIIFGVGSVIAMLAIGEGASFEAREQIRNMGSSNIIIKSRKPEASTSASTKTQHLSVYGLTYDDAMRIRTLFPSILIDVPIREITTQLRCNAVQLPAKVIGTIPWHLNNTHGTLLYGRFIDAYDMRTGDNSVVLCENTAQKLFPLEFPIGKKVYVDNKAYMVVGVVSDSVGPESGNKEGADRPSREIYEAYISITAARKRFGDIIAKRETGSMSMEKVEIHQLTVTAPSDDVVGSMADAIRTCLNTTHKQADYEMVIPLELLKQAENTKRIFNIVLGSIAAISLLVGGIGIMNIMLASVTERTREIGTRRALGATRQDIVLQFLVEAVLLSVIGGFIGVGLGIAVPKIVTLIVGLSTIIQGYSILMAFCISMATGVIFGIYPAIRAASLSPIEALRHE